MSDIPDPADLLAVCEAALGHARGARAHELEVFYEAGAVLDVDVEADAVSGTNLARSQGGAVRAIRDGRLGFAYFTDPDGAADAVKAAVANARLAPRKGFRLPGPDGAPGTLPDRWDDAIAAMEAEECVRAARDMVAAAKDACPDATVAGGGTARSWHVWALANSQGVRASDRTTAASVAASLTLPDGESAINSWDVETLHVGMPDAARVAEEAARTVRSLRDPKDGPTGTADVVFLPDAAASLLAAGVLPALDGDTARRGKSVWSEKHGEGVAHAGLHLVDAPLDPAGIGTTPFDGDGQATQDLSLIEAGVLRSFVFDAWHGHEHGTRSTRSAVRDSFKSLPGAGTHHLLVSHDETRSLDDLVGGIEDGYLVESVLGAHTANATTGDFSVTAPNVWRIEGGAVKGAATGIAVAGNLPSLLARLDGASDAPKRSDGITIPALRVRDIAVSR